MKNIDAILRQSVKIMIDGFYDIRVGNLMFNVLCVMHHANVSVHFESVCFVVILQQH